MYAHTPVRVYVCRAQRRRDFPATNQILANEIQTASRQLNQAVAAEVAGAYLSRAPRDVCADACGYARFMRA